METHSTNGAEPELVTWRVLAEAGDTGEHFAVVALTLPPHHSGVPAHTHLAHAEGCYVVAGSLAVTHDEQTVMLTPGRAVHIAAGVPHSVWNPTAGATIVLVIYTPGVSAALADALVAGELGDAPPYADTS
jgi:quercetin dioxygenase-like cupin family protein